MVIVIAVFNENVLLEMDLRTILLLQIREERYMLYKGNMLLHSVKDLVVST